MHGLPLYHRHREVMEKTVIPNSGLPADSQTFSRNTRLGIRGRQWQTMEDRKTMADNGRQWPKKEVRLKMAEIGSHWFPRVSCYIRQGRKWQEMVEKRRPGRKWQKRPPSVSALALRHFYTTLFFILSTIDMLITEYRSFIYPF